MEAYVNELNRRAFNPALLLALLSSEETGALGREGERATWPKIEMIRNCTEVSRCSNRCVGRLHAGPLATSVASPGAEPLPSLQAV